MLFQIKLFLVLCRLPLSGTQITGKSNSNLASTKVWLNYWRWTTKSFKVHLTLKERYVLWHAPFPPSGITLQNLLYKRWFLWVSKYNYHLFSDQVRRGVGQFLIWRHALHTLQACLHRRNAAWIDLWCQITNTPSNSVRKQMTLSYVILFKKKGARMHFTKNIFCG